MNTTVGYVKNRLVVRETTVGKNRALFERLWDQAEDENTRFLVVSRSVVNNSEDSRIIRTCDVEGANPRSRERNG